MIEVRHPAREVRHLRVRLAVALLAATAGFGILAARLWTLQVARYDAYHAQAEDNRITLVPVPPTRGIILDRHGVVLAENVSAYTLELSPARIDDLDRTIEQIGQIVEVSARDRRRFRKLLEETKNAEWVPLKTRLTDDEVARLAASRWRFAGMDVKARPFRTYPLGETASHVLGYIGRLSTDDKQRIEEAELASEYAGSTHVGKVGVEQSYERALHGRTGYEEVEVSAGGRGVRTLSRRDALPGSNLVLSIDLTLQKLVEDLYGDRRGALVALDPATGEVLAFVSKPTFDPNLFIDGIDPQSWSALNDSPDKPLLNRPLRGTYPPGSTYKPFMALAALASGKRTPTQTISDPGYFMFGGHRFRDSRPGGHGTVNLHRSIVVSSDTYYYSLANDMGVDTIHDFMKPWGFGQLTGIDLQGEATGVLPSTRWKMRRYKQRWMPGETISIGIGQGYNTFTLLQLAHATATLAADGVVRQPHLVRAIEDPATRRREPLALRPEYRIALRPEWLALVKSAMVEVNRVGTGRMAFAGAPYAVAGKTGTAQVIGIKQNEKYDARRVAERHRDHSLYMAFAPAGAPRIALALIVENGGFGAASAAPIARAAFDWYLLGKLPKDYQDSTAEGRARQPEPSPELRDVPESLEPEPEAGTGPGTMRPASAAGGAEQTPRAQPPGAAAAQGSTAAAAAAPPPPAAIVPASLAAALPGRRAGGVARALP